MSHPLSVRSVAIGALIVSLTIGSASNLLFLAAFQFRLDWFLEPTRLITAGEASAELLRWASVLDLVGYYLATGVLAYALWRMLRPRDPVLADLSMLAAMGFTIAGGAAAAVLAMVGPMLLEHHAAAAGGNQAVTQAQFAVLFEGVWRSVWQLFDAMLLAAWWLGIGLLVRSGHALVSRLALALSAVAMVGVLFSMLGLSLARDVMLGIVFTLWTAWWVILLVAFATNRAPFAAELDDQQGGGLPSFNGE